ncbi:MAG: hypothetical protein ACRDT2_09360 [Natronosporangium sp.]
MTERLSFGRLSRLYRDAADQLPEVLSHHPIDPATIRCRRWSAGEIVRSRLWLLSLPSGQVVAGLSLDVDCPLIGTIRLLEDCYELDLAIGGTGLEAGLAAEARSHRVWLGSPRLAPERHQLVFSKELTVDDPADLLQRVVYRADLPYRPEHSSIAYPPELNRRPGTTAAVGPYVTAFCGQQDYLENAAFASAVQLVASAVRVREIRETAHHDLRSLSGAGPVRHATRARRRQLERTADALTRLELDLSLAVEAPGDLGALVPSLRAVDYHRQVYASAGLADRTATVSQMLRRLEGTIRSELTSIESVERRTDENRRMRWSVAIGFVTSVALPFSLVLAFFGINASQVDPDRSMFDSGYAGVYAGVGLLAVIAAGLGLALYLVQLRQRRESSGPSDDASIPTPRPPEPVTRSAGSPAPEPPAHRPDDDSHTPSDPHAIRDC